MTLRGRLTLLIGSTLTLALLGFSAALYLALARTTLAMTEEALAREAGRLLGDTRFALGTLMEAPERVGLPATYVQTLDAAGKPLARSTNLTDATIPLSAAGMDTVRRGASWAEIWPKEEKRLLVYSVPVRSGETVVGTLQLARSLTDRDDALASLRVLLAAGGLLTLLLAGGLGWILAGAALQPIAHMTRAAQTIGRERDFTRRLPIVASHDEVGALSATLNAMLAELDGAHGQVAQALDAQRRFIADASHELRTPLTTIRGFLALLERDPPISAQDARTALRGTIAETDRLIRLVNQLFLLARTDAGQLRYRIVPVPLEPLIEMLTAQARVRAVGRVVTVQIASGLTAMGDADAIAQVLVNLLDNAIAHTPPRASITLSAQAICERAVICVSDTGLGIPPEQLPHLFERFYRGDQARAGAGAGLGLAIARAVAEAQGGTLSASSSPGQGSSFTLSLPLAAGQPHGAEAPSIIR